MPPELDHLLRDRSDLVKAIRRDLSGLPDDEPWPGKANALAVVKALAWALRGEGWGLVAAKPGSENNVEGFTTDVIALSDGEHVDVLIDSGGNNFATWDPVRHRADWQQSWNDAIASRWLPALAPEGPPAPHTDAPPPPDEPPSNDAELIEALVDALSGVEGRLETIEQALANMGLRIDRIDERIALQEYEGSVRFLGAFRLRPVPRG
jgi:hypothetical protein